MVVYSCEEENSWVEIKYKISVVLISVSLGVTQGEVNIDSLVDAERRRGKIEIGATVKFLNLAGRRIAISTN